MQNVSSETSKEADNWETQA